MNYIISFILLLLPLASIAQAEYHVYAYETHPLRKRGVKMIREYAKEFINKEDRLLNRICENTNVPKRYREGTLYSDSKGVYFDAVIYNYGNKGGYKGIVTYGTWAFLAKEGRARIELRDVKYLGAKNGCPQKGVLEKYIECLEKEDVAGNERIKLHHTAKLYSVSAVYKDFLASTNGRKTDEINIGDDW